MADAIHALWDEDEPVPATYTSEDAARDCADVAYDALLDSELASRRED